MFAFEPEGSVEADVCAGHVPVMPPLGRHVPVMPPLSKKRRVQKKPAAASAPERATKAIGSKRCRFAVGSPEWLDIRKNWPMGPCTVEELFAWDQRLVRQILLRSEWLQRRVVLP